MRVQGPILDGRESLDLALAFDDQPQSDGLHAPGGKAATNLVPQQRRNLVAHDAVEHAPGLLRIHQVLIDFARVLECLLHGPLGDLVEADAHDALGSALRRLGAVAELAGKVPGDGFAFAIRVGRQVDCVGILGKLLQPGQNLFFSGDYLI